MVQEDRDAQLEQEMKDNPELAHKKKEAEIAAIVVTAAN